MSIMAEKITSVDSDKQESTANVLKALPAKVISSKRKFSKK